MPTSDPADLLPGTLDLLILKAVSAGPLHGLGVSRRIEQMTATERSGVKPGSLFPALHRMAEQKWLVSEWGESEANRRARYYRLTHKEQKTTGNGEGALGSRGACDRPRPGVT